jgi:nucleotide-binding universal stress UspA family protein
LVERNETAAAEAASKILSSVSEAANKQAVKFETIHIKDQTPAEGIIAAAKEKACDLIVMASHGRRGLERMLLGSQAQKVVTLSNLAVLVWR